MKRCRDCVNARVRPNSTQTGSEVYCSELMWTMGHISLETFNRNPLSPVVVGPKPPKSVAEYCEHYTSNEEDSEAGDTGVQGLP